MVIMNGSTKSDWVPFVGGMHRGAIPTFLWVDVYRIWYHFKTAIPCGRNSAVECRLPKPVVVGSNPIARFSRPPGSRSLAR